MTISSQTRKAGPFIGNGTTTAFPFSFKVFAASDLQVVRANSAGVETILTLNSDYTVTLNANQTSNPGGTVTLAAALATGSTMVLTSVIEYLQPTDLTNQGGFYPAVINTSLDRLTILTQQLKEQVDRSAKLPITNDADADALVADIVRIADSAANIDTVAGSINNVNTVADDIANVNTTATNMAAIIAAPTQAENAAASASASATSATNAASSATAAASSATAASGSASTASTQATNAANSATAAAGSATTATTQATNAANSATAAETSATSAANSATSAASSATAAAASYDEFDDRYLGAKTSNPTTDNDGNALMVGAIYFNSVAMTMRVWNGTAWQDQAASPDTLSEREFLATAGQTTYTFTGGYRVGYTFVYVNGVLLGSGDITATNGTTITFASALALNDEVRILSFKAIGSVGVSDISGLQAALDGKVAGAAATSSVGGDLKLYEATANGVNYTGFKAPNALAANVTYTLPTADGTNGQVLATNGSGTLSWSSASGSSQWTTSGSNIYYNTGAVLGGTSSSIGSTPMRFQSKGGSGGTLPGAGYSIISGFDEVAGHFSITSSGENSVVLAADPQNLRSSSSLQFSVDGSERARINSDGNLLVGTTSQLATNLRNTITRQQIPVSNSTAWADQMSPLVVYGNFGDGSNDQGVSSALTLVGWSSLAGNVGAIMRGWWSQTGAGLSTPTLKIQIAHTGNVTNLNNSYGSLSDARLKENITDATPKLENLNKLRVVNFNLKADPDKQKQIGLIAQEVEEVFPGLVETDGEGNKSVKYSVLVPMLLKAVQEQQAVIEQLKADVAALKGQA